MLVITPVLEDKGVKNYSYLNPVQNYSAWGQNPFHPQFAVLRPALCSAAVLYKTAFFSSNPEISGNHNFFPRFLVCFFYAFDVFFAPSLQFYS